MPAAPELERVPFTGLLVAFAGELRAAGLAVGSGDVLLYCSALARLNPADLVDLYWAGRTTLVNRRDDIAVYDRVFRRFFLGADEAASYPFTLMLRASAEAQGALAVPSTEPGESEGEDDAILGWMASDVAALKHKSFGACTPEELVAIGAERGARVGELPHALPGVLIVDPTQIPDDGRGTIAQARLRVHFPAATSVALSRPALLRFNACSAR